MSQEQTLGYRMKRYEEASKSTLPFRLPVVIRVDGKAFSKLTNCLKKNGCPFNTNFMDVMNEVAIKLCHEIQGAEVAYVQSDEISVLIHGYKNHVSQGWFDNKLQKIVSVSAALAASTFTFHSGRIFDTLKQVAFDARAFVLPEHDVFNYFLWRQKDALRNSVQMLARSYFSQGQLNEKSNNDMISMLNDVGVNWNELPVGIQRGRIVQRRKQPYTISYKGENKQIERNVWLAEDAPLFSTNKELFKSFLEIDSDVI